MRRWLPVLTTLTLILSGCGMLPDWLATPTPAPYFEASCAFSWANRALPDVTAQLTAALAQAHVTGATISASAFGENCYNADGTLRSFGAMETDYALTIPADQLADALAVLGSEAQAGRAGPKPGRIALTIGRDGDSIQLQVVFKAATDAVAQGLRGEALITALKTS